MTTFKQFLAEAPVSVKELIEKNCGPFLRRSKGAGFLHRGVKDFNSLDYEIATLYDGSKTTYAVKQVRQDRKPLGTSQVVHEMIDEWFEKNFGFKARSTTMFCLGNIPRTSLVAAYGTPCVVFPAGAIKFVWSPRVRDLYVSMPYENWTEVEGLKGDELRQRIWEWLDRHEYQDTNLDEAIKSQREIMIQCDKYYAFDAALNKMELQISLDIFPD